MKDHYYRSGDGYVITFSITSTESFLEAKVCRKELYRIQNKDESEYIPFILVGNKCDLESERQVSKAEAETIAEEWGVEYIETSAKKDINVSKLFEKLARDIENYKLEDSENPVESKTEPKSKDRCIIM